MGPGICRRGFEGEQDWLLVFFWTKETLFYTEGLMDTFVVNEEEWQILLLDRKELGVGLEFCLVLFEPFSFFGSFCFCFPGVFLGFRWVFRVLFCKTVKR